MWCAYIVWLSGLYLIIFTQVIDTAQLLETISKECPKLRYLSLLGNIACPNELLGSGHDDEDYQRYRSLHCMMIFSAFSLACLFRYFVLFKLPNLTFLDSRSVADTERKEARRVGKFMKVVRPSDEEVGSIMNSKQKRFIFKCFYR